MEKSFIIPAENFTNLESNISKVNKKVTKFDGFEPITMEVVRTFFRNETEEDAQSHRKMIEIKISGEIPYFKGWEFVAMLDFDKMNKVVFVHSLRNIELPEEYMKKTSIGCDHCNHNRYRAKSFVIFNSETNEYKEIGSTCLKKFFQSDISKVLPFIKMFDGIEEPTSGGGECEYYSETLEFIIAAKYITDRFEYVSKSKAYNSKNKLKSTIERIYAFIGTPEMLKIKNSDIRYAKNAIEYFHNITTDNNDYLINMKNIAKMEFISNKKAGYAASMIQAFDKANKQKEIKEKQEANPSEYYGNVGDRIKKLPVKIIMTRDIETQYGTTKLYKMEDCSGNIFSSFYSGYTFNFDSDDDVILTGTIKCHEEYRGVKQTMLNRIKLVDA